MTGERDDQWLQNTTTPLPQVRFCRCHNWRYDECPNTAVTDVVKELQRMREIVILKHDDEVTM